MDDIPFNIQNIQNLLEINYLSNLIKSCEKNGLNKKYLLEEKLLKLSENSEIKLLKVVFLIGKIRSVNCIFFYLPSRLYACLIPFSNADISDNQ